MSKTNKIFSTLSPQGKKSKAIMTPGEFLLILIIGCALAIPMITIGVENLDNECYSDATGSFTYGTWLVVQGVYLLTAICIQGITSVWNNDCIYLLLVIIGALFQLSWFITGSVLFWTTMPVEDCSKTTVWQFGLSIFILEFIGIWTQICRYATRQD